jgi:D-beta-D-heptose 7-phosphate kinase/D-beta-D-heptose 1-phosphate adenosyltransferase
MREPSDHESSFEAILARFPLARILVIGDVMLDRFSYGNVRRISPEAPAAVIHLDRIEEIVGGAGNVARNIAALGARCDLVGIIGQDEAAHIVCRCLGEESGVTPHLIHASDRATTVKSRFVARLHNTHLLRADVEDVTPISMETEGKVVAAATKLMKHADAVLLSDYGKGMLTDAVIRQIIERAREAGLVVIADPKGRHYERYRGAQYVTPNLAELAEAVRLPVDSEEHQIEAARNLVELIGLEAVVLTRGEQGVLLVPRAGEPRAFPATARRVIDVSGAGDTLVGSFATALVCGATAPSATRLANYAAGIVVGKRGTAATSIDELKDVLLSRPDFRSKSKIFNSVADLQRLIADWRDTGYVVGFTNGCFDLLHEGHVELLAEARSHCDRLVVGLNSDASVRTLKGSQRPIQSERARARIMSALEFVDAVTIFDAETPLELITQIRPNVLIKGADYRIDQVVGREEVEAHGGRVVLVDLVPNSSTTRIVEKMRT